MYANKVDMIIHNRFKNVSAISRIKTEESERYI
jgi:hypothetical protein